MEVDRVSQMAGLRQEADPSWTRDKVRRRKFSQDDPEPDDQTEELDQPSSEPDEEEKPDGSFDVIA